MCPIEGPGRPSVDDDRLVGWKDIAAFLGRGVRTAQRWEREFGLPVHRPGGDTVVAFKPEVARWVQASAEARARTRTADDESGDAQPELPFGPAANGPGRRVLWWLVAWLLVASVSGAWWLAAGRRSGPVGGPARWRVGDDRLTVFDSIGRVLWSHRFELDLDEEVYEPRPARDGHLPVPVQVLDLDDDGVSEVVFAVVSRQVTRPSLIVFDADGRPRFSNAPPAQPLRFGGEEFPPEWMVMGTWTTLNTRRERSLWVVYYQRPYFPSLLTRLDTRGAVRAEYVSNGYVTAVTEAEWNGRDAVFVGAINNETRGGSLAVFADGQVRGSAPAEDPQYRCENCPPGGPDHFLVFPRPCLSAWPGNLTPLAEAGVGPGGQVWAVVLHDRLDQLRPDQAPATVRYEMDRNLAPVRVRVDRAFSQRHREFQARGWLDHPLDVSDATKGLPVKRWVNPRFVDLPPAAVEIDW